MLREQLIQLDFTPNQADTYLALLELGQTKVGPIISKTGFHRNIVYRALEDLIARKLVYKITKRGVAYFEATDPAPLLNEVERKKELARSLIKEIKQKKSISQSEIIVLHGHQGVIDLCEMVLNLGENLYLLGANFRIMETHKEYYPSFEERLIKKGIARFVLPSAQYRGYEHLNREAQTKFLPPSFSPSPVVIWIFGDRIAHVLWEQPETIIVVKNKKIADDYREYFHLLWNQDNWILNGKEGFFELLEIVSEQQQDLYFLNATGGGLKLYLEEYKQWMRAFTGQGNTIFWLTTPDFNVDISNIGERHQIKRLKAKITSPTVYWVFGAYVANVLWEADMPTIFLLRNKSVAQSYRDYFDYLWKHGSVPFKS